MPPFRLPLAARFAPLFREPLAARFVPPDVLRFVLFVEDFPVFEGRSGSSSALAEARQRQKRLNRKVVLVLLALLVIGLLLRGFAMNWQ